MLLEISNTIRIVSISIDTSLINANSRPAINVGIFLTDNITNNNNCEKDPKDCTLAMRYQKTIKKSAILFLVNSISKDIKSIHF